MQLGCKVRLMALAGQAFLRERQSSEYGQKEVYVYKFRGVQVAAG